MRQGRDLPLDVPLEGSPAAAGAHGDRAAPGVTAARLCMKRTQEV